MIIINILIFLAITALLLIFKPEKFTWAQDHLFTREFSLFKYGILTYDKLQHYLIGFIFIMVDASLSNVLFTIINLAFWELKDGFLNYKKYGIIGGDGFSIIDLFVGYLGVSTALAIRGLLGFL